ncbi:MAG: N-acetyl-gamma-glutamyl-phosphate reductase [Gammaproteobacteria bacterium]
MKNYLNIMIAGAHGYAGQIFMHLVQRHPKLQLTGIIQKISQATGINPHYPCYTPEQLITHNIYTDVIVLATPPAESQQLVYTLSKQCNLLIDLSGAFRLPAAQYQQWYQQVHQHPQLLMQAHYGLSPWTQHAVKHKHLIANPGCYATAALMALMPLVKHNVIDPTDIIIDAKSGATGAGKQLNHELLFCELNENFYAYKIGCHQHTPEITNQLNQVSALPCHIILTTQLLPIKRGIALTIYANVDNPHHTEAHVRNAIAHAYQSSYGNYPLLDWVDFQHDAMLAKQYLALTSVIGTAKTHIVFSVQQHKILLFVCLDNLMKGCASQAVENINAYYDWPLNTGLVPPTSTYDQTNTTIYSQEAVACS